MSDKSYQIIVTGELVDGTYLPDVKAKLASLFNTSAEKLDPLFSGKRVVIKKGLGEDAAQKYVAAVRAAGLLCIAEALGTEVVVKTSVETTAGVSLAPVGVILAEAPKIAAAQIDTSAFSVAPVGGNLVEHTPPQAPAIDTSALSMAPPGAQLVEPQTVATPVIDTSDLDLAPVGSDVGEMKRGDAPPPPDTSHLKLD